jgi:hypothetical protein
MAANKKPRPQRPIIEEPKLLVLHEKHGELYFHIPDEPTLFKVALDIVTKRAKSGYWYIDPEEYKPITPSMTKEAAEALPEGPARKAALQEQATYKRERAVYADALETAEYIAKAINEKDGRAAWQVLRDHSDGEYQRVSLEAYSEEYYDNG